MSAVLQEGRYVVALACPQCGLLASALIDVHSRLSVETGGDSSLRAVVKQKPVPHTCGQPELHPVPEAGDDADAPGYEQPALDWAERAAGGRDDD